MRKIFCVFIVAIIICSMATVMVACNDNDESDVEGKLTITFLGDSIAEALIGASPVSERDNYGYYALVGKSDNMNYYNHSMSGHLTSGNMVDKAGEGLLEVVSREDETATLIRTHIIEADVIHISVLGNNMLQFSLGSLMMEMADRNEGKTGADKWYQACFEGYENQAELVAKYADNKDLFEYLHDGGSVNVVRPVMRLEGNEVVYGSVDETLADPIFNFPPTYQNVVDIVAKLRELNPTAKIVFQKVYNPLFEGSTLLKEAEYKALAQRGYDSIEKLRALAQDLLDYLNGMLDEYNENNPQNQVEILDINKVFDDIANRDTVDGKVNLSADCLGRKLIYNDWTHPSNFGHAIIAGATHELLVKWGMADDGAVENYKAIKCDQIDRMYASIGGFDASNAKREINACETFDEVTFAYFEAVDGFTPVGYGW